MNEILTRPPAPRWLAGLLRPRPGSRFRRLTAAGVGLAAVAAFASAAPAVASPAGHPARPGADTWLPVPDQAPSENGLARTPPMGYNNYTYELVAGTAAQPSQQLFTDTANALVKTGLARDGYVYVNSDAGWAQQDRDASGNMVADPTLFPNGMKWLASYIHSKGLKFGLYERVGVGTPPCVYPDPVGFEQQDADTLAAWGVDYLKVDACHSTSPSAQAFQDEYTLMSNALKASGRKIVYSESAPAYFLGQPDYNTVMSWVPQEGNLYRIGSDIADNWNSVMTNYEQDSAPGMAAYAGPGHFNDPDMLEVGNPGLTTTEQQSQFTVWSELAAPLLISTDVANLSPAALAILSNKAVIAVDQDRYGAQGTLVAQQGDIDVLAKPLANGDIALVLFNTGAATEHASVTAAQAGFSVHAPAWRLDNLWTHRTTTSKGLIGATVPAHGTVMFRITPLRAGR